MKKVPTARDCMSPTLFTLHPEIDVYEAIDVLVKRNASGAPVLDDEGHLVGILTEKDCLRVLSHSAWGTLGGGKVKDYMSEVKMTVEANMDVFAIVDVFLACNFPSLPVLENGKLVGRITRLDVLRGIQRLQEAVEEKKRSEERTLKILQSPSSIDELQTLVGSQRKENVAALFRSRYGDGGGI